MTTRPEDLLTETIDAMVEHGKTPSDVVGVLTATGTSCCTWSTFADLAAKFDYETGQEIADIVVVFGDGSWLERDDHNGFEWWAYKAVPRLTADTAELTADDLKAWN
jgi:hypothetical protein